MTASKRIFISAPIDREWSTVLRFSGKLQKAGLVPVFWDRKPRYDQEEFDACDGVLFLLPGNLFSAAHDQLPIGLKSELSRAYALGKPVYVGYTTNNGRDNIYYAETNGKWIKGEAGTADELLSFAPQKKMTDRYGFDKLATTNPCGEIELPKAQEVCALTIPNTDRLDERLLLML